MIQRVNVADINEIRSSNPIDRDSIQFSNVYYSNRETYRPHRLFYKFQTPNSYNLVFGSKNMITTQDDEVIKSHYANPLSEVNITTSYRSAKRVGDEIKISLNTIIKKRDFNYRYYKKHTVSRFFKFNTKTGNFLTYSNDGKVKRFRVNNFNQLRSILHSIYSTRSSSFNIINMYHPQDVFNEEICKLFGTELMSKNSALDYIMSEFVRLKEIKTPNGPYESLLHDEYPTEKFLKKNDRNLIPSILDKLNIKTGFTVRLLTENLRMDINTLKFFIELFGSTKYLNSVKDFIVAHKFGYNNVGSEFRLTKSEKSNLVKVLNTLTLRSSITPSYLYDHYNMISLIKMHGIECESRSTTEKTFIEEHRTLSTMLNKIKRGSMRELVFDEEVVNEIEKPIDFLHEDNNLISYQPKLLISEEEYVEEGSFMSHCVSSYYGKNSRSIIVSLRKVGHTDRVTCEFTKKDGQLVQSKYYSNKPAPTEFKEVIQGVLINKIRGLVKTNSLDVLGEKLKPLVIDGVEIKNVELMGGKEMYNNAHHLDLPW